MPVMNGFQFVEDFEQLPAAVTSKYSIFIISSSINDDDLNRVHNYKSISQFLNKPLTSNNLSLLISKE
jgi:CheY-like chemotaxis protein